MHKSLIIGLLLAGVASASGGIGGFTETFEAGNANWRNFDGSTGLDWVPNGGADGSAYASATYNTLNFGGGFPPIVLRGQSNFSSSGNEFVGNWVKAGITGVSFDLRHNLPVSTNITGRFSTPVNFPGASTTTFVPIAPNTWTTVFFDLTEGSSDIISLGGGTYDQIFTDIARIQIGSEIPGSLIGQEFIARFDIDNIQIIPTPGGAALFALAGVGFIRRKR